MTGTALSPSTDGGGRKAQNRSWGELTFIKGNSLFWLFSRFIHHSIFTRIMWFSMCAPPFPSLVSWFICFCSGMLKAGANHCTATTAQVGGEGISSWKICVWIFLISYAFIRSENQRFGIKWSQQVEVSECKMGCRFQNGGFNSYMKPYKTNY